MSVLKKGRYTVRLAESTTDLEAAQLLRYLAFRASDQPVEDGRDHDPFDATSQHVLVEQTASGQLVCCFRIMPLENGRAIGKCYSAQYYELSSLRRHYDKKMLEVGRFCSHPAHHDPDIMRLAWGWLAQYVERSGVGMLFGCSSFQGTCEIAYLDAFSLLKEHHLAPKRWLPRVKAPRIFPFARKLARRAPDQKAAMARMPPLLRSYLMMGGWVSDHAVVDRDLNTLHVFTGLEIGAIPPARKRLLQAVAG